MTEIMFRIRTIFLTDRTSAIHTISLQYSEVKGSYVAYLMLMMNYIHFGLWWSSNTFKRTKVSEDQVTED